MTVFQKNINRVCPILDFLIPDYPTSENPMQLNKDILNTDLLSKEKRNTDIQNTPSLPFPTTFLIPLLLSGMQHHRWNGNERIKLSKKKISFGASIGKEYSFP